MIATNNDFATFRAVKFQIVYAYIHIYIYTCVSKKKDRARRVFNTRVSSSQFDRVINDRQSLHQRRPVYAVRNQRNKVN